MYSKKAMNYFKSPKNMGKIEDADGVGTVGNPTCGDVMKIYIKVKNDRIVDIKVETFGCVAAIVTSSALTEMVKGKKIKDALKVTKKEIADKLDGLPPLKLHCSVLAISALKAAVEDYKKKKSL